MARLIQKPSCVALPVPRFCIQRTKRWRNWVVPLKPSSFADICVLKHFVEINDGLNVVENWNSANGFVFFGKGGEIATNRVEDQKISALSFPTKLSQKPRVSFARRAATIASEIRCLASVISVCAIAGLSSAISLHAGTLSIHSKKCLKIKSTRALISLNRMSQYLGNFAEVSPSSNNVSSNSARQF